MLDWSFYLELMEMGYKMRFLIITDRIGEKERKKVEFRRKA